MVVGLFSGYCFTKRWISLSLLEYFLSLSLFLRFCCSVCTLVGLLFMLDVFGSNVIDVVYNYVGRSIID